MRVLLIDDIREIEADVVARTYEEGLAALMDSGPFDLLLLDHDLGDDDPRKTGMGIMNFLEANSQYIPGDIHFVTSNPVGRKQMGVVRQKLYENKEGK